MLNGLLLLLLLYVLSHVQLFVTPWTLAYEFPLFLGFSRQEYWSGLLFPTPGDLPDSGIGPASLCIDRQILYQLNHLGVHLNGRVYALFRKMTIEVFHSFFKLSCLCCFYDFDIELFELFICFGDEILISK